VTEATHTDAEATQGGCPVVDVDPAADD